MSLLLTLGLGGSGTPPTPPTGGDTPYMNLLLPTVSVTLGPLYATEVNNAFLRVDSHDHSDGFGHRVGTNGLNINSDLTFHGFNATNLLSTGYNIQSPTAGLTGTLYFQGQDLWIADGAGNNFAITAAGAVNIPPGVGGWTGLTAPAAAEYDSVTKKFSLKSNTSPLTYGLLATGDILLYPGDPNLGSLPYIRIATPNSGVSTYTLGLPTAAPYSGVGTKQTLVSMRADGQLLLGPTAPAAGPNFLRMDSSGVPAADVALTGTTLQLAGPSSGVYGLRVAPGGITSTEIAAATITPDRLQIQAVTSAALSGTVSTSTPTTIGGAGLLISAAANRYVMFTLKSTTPFPGFKFNDPVTGGGQACFIELYQDGVMVNQAYFLGQVAGQDLSIPTNCISCVIPATNGLRSFDIRMWTNSVTGGVVTATGIVLTAQVI